MKNQKSRERTKIFPPVRCVLGVVLGGSMIFNVSTAEAAEDALGDTQDSAAAPLTFPEQFEQKVINGSKVFGRIGVYDFRGWHNLNQPFPGQPNSGRNDDVQGTNYGAQIGLQTGRIYGFSAGTQLTYESSFYGNNKLGTKLDCNLDCGRSLTDVTQGYLQFNSYGAQIRAGRQLLNTPLASADQFTFLPRAYDGVSITARPLQMFRRMRFRWDDESSANAKAPNGYGPQITRSRIADTQNYETDQYLPFSLNIGKQPISDWQVFAAKIDHMEARGNSDHFTDDNFYFQNIAGFWTVGTSFHNMTPSGELIGQYYHYRFQETLSADYGEIGFMGQNLGLGNTEIFPYIRAQAMAEYNADKDRIPQGINSQIYGLKLGFTTPKFGASIFGNFSPIHNGSFNHGQMLHPYFDLSGVLYTDAMEDGIEEYGPGWAAGLRLDYHPTSNLSVYARYVRFLAHYGHYHDFLYFGPYRQIDSNSFVGNEVRNQGSNGFGGGFDYNLGGVWKQLAGLHISDNLGIASFDHGAPTFYENRARFYYQF